MQTTGRATTKTETSPDRRLKAAVQHFLLLALSYSSKHFKISYFAPSLPRENRCEVWRYNLKKQRSFPELAEVPCVTFSLSPGSSRGMI